MRYLTAQIGFEAIYPGEFMKMKSIALAASVTALCILSACQQMDDLQEMHDATANMNKTTSELNAKTGELIRLTTDVDDGADKKLIPMTTAIIMQSRQGGTATVRHDSITRMEAADDIIAKIGQAAIYMDSFEFQVWDDKSDSDGARDVFMTEAVDELFTIVSKYSVADHYQIYSVLDVLEQGMALSNQVGKMVNGAVYQDSDMPSWALEVRKFSDAFTYLLRLRHNFLPTMPLTDISNVNVGGFLGLASLYAKLEMPMFAWTPNFAPVNSAKMSFDLSKIKLANDLALKLKSWDIDPLTDGQLVKTYKHMKVSPLSPEDVLSGKETLVKSFYTEVQTFIDHE